MQRDNQLQKWRHDTPGVDHLIHLNNAGAALMPREVVEAMKHHLDLEARMGGYEAAAHVAKDIKSLYQNLANLFGGSATNYAFTANATDAYNRALSAIPFEKNDTIITTTNDYASNFLAFLSLKKRFGISIVTADNTGTGEVELASIARLVHELHPKLVAITHIPTNSGLVQPVQEIGAICEAHQVIYLVDGCQSAGQLQVDVPALKCDFYSATFRKFLRGPRGAGFLYVSDRMLDDDYHPLFLDMRGADWSTQDSFSLRSDATRFEDWENAYALLLGASAALNYAHQVGMEIIQERIIELSSRLRHDLGELPRIKVLDRGSTKGAIVSVTSPSWQQEALRQYLTSHRINGSFVNRTSALLDFDEKQVSWALRLSPHYYNTFEEIEHVVEVLSEFT